MFLQGIFTKGYTMSIDAASIGSSNQLMQIQGLVDTQGGGFNVNGFSNVIIGTPSGEVFPQGPATISTRTTGTNTSYSSAPSTGNSGSLSITVANSDPNNPILNVGFNAPAITVEPGSDLFAQATNSYQAGGITLKANNTNYTLDGLSFPTLEATMRQSTVDFMDSTAGSPTVVDGGTIDIEANAGDIPLVSTLAGSGTDQSSDEQFASWGPWVGTLLSTALQATSLIPGLNLAVLPVSINYRNAASTVTAGEYTQITGSGNVTLASSSTADAEGQAIYRLGTQFGAAIAFMMGTTDAQMNVCSNAQITSTGGDITLSSTANTTDTDTARVSQNTGTAPVNSDDIAIALGVGVINQTANATVAKSATVMASGDINLTSTGNTENTAIPTTGTYVSGLAGVAVGVNVTENHVTTTEDGTMISGAGTSAPALTFDPDTGVDFANNAIKVSPSAMAKLQTGQSFTYSSNDNGPIGGLTSGTTYYIIVPSTLTDEIQLAATAADADNGTFIPFRQYPTLTDISLSPPVTVPISDVNETDGTITFDSNPGFNDGDTLTYNAVADEAIDGLSDGTYYAIVNSASPDTLQLFSSPRKNGQDGAVVPLNLDPGFTGLQQRLGVTVNPSHMQPNTIQFNFNAGFTLGDSFIYQGSFISGLTPGVRYWSIPDSQDSTSTSTVIQLADSEQDAEAGNALSISSNTVGGVNVFTFDPSVSIDSTDNTIDAGFNIALAGTLSSGASLIYHGALGSVVQGLVDGQTYYVILDSQNPRLMRLTSTSATAAEATAAAGTAFFTAQSQAAYTAAYDAFLASNPGDTSDAVKAGNAGEATAISNANNGQDWTATGIDNARIGSPYSVGTFNVTVNPPGQPVPGSGSTIEFGFDAGFVKNEPLVYEGPATANDEGITGLTVGQTYYITLPDRINHPGLVAFVDSSGNPISVSLASGTTTNVMFAAPTSDNVSVSSNQITFNNLSDPNSSVPFDPGLQTGDPFVYLGPVASSDSAIPALTAGTVYYVILTSTPGIIELDDSQQDALSHTPTPLKFGPSTGALTTNANYAVPFTPEDTRPVVVTAFGGIDTSLMAFDDPFTASPNTLTPQGTAGVNISATLTDSQNSFVASGIGGTPSVQDAIAKPEVAAPAVNSAITSGTSGSSPSSLQSLLASLPGSTGQSPNFSLAGSVFVQVTPVDIVNAEVGADARIESGTNVAISASLTQTVDSSTTASLTGQDGDQQSTSSGLAGALALGIGYYTPTVTAEIDSSASVDAAGTISVTATTTIPLEVPQSVNSVEGDILYNSGNPNYNLLNFLTGFITDGMLGLGTDILNNIASSKVNTNDEARTALGGNIQFCDYVNDTQATIGDANINQKVSDPNALGTNQGIVFRNAAQSVSVSAKTDYENAAEAGSFDLNLSPASLIQNIRDKGLKQGLGSAIDLVGDSKGQNAIGASVFIDVVSNTTSATIDSGAQIVVGSAGSLDVNAKQITIAFSLVQSGDAGGNLGIAGMIAWYNVTDHTTAQIQDGVTVNGGKDVAGNIVQGGPVSVTADDKTILVGVTGGAVTGNHIGVGFAMAVNNVNRTTLALIGSTSTPTEPGSYDIASLDVGATDEGQVGTLTYAAAFISPTQGQVQSNNNPIPDNVGFSWSDLGVSNPLTAQSGYGIAGAVSANVLQSDTEAYVNDPGTITTPSSALPLASSPTAPPSTVIHFSQPPNLPTGTPVAYFADSPISGLTNNDTDYVIAVDKYDIELADSPTDAAAGIPLPLDASSATGTQTLTPPSGTAITFDPSAVETTILSFTQPHGLETGQAIEYEAGSSPIGGLTSGQTYYAIVLNPNQIELADSFNDAGAGNAIALDFSAASGVQSFVPVTVDINAATRTIVVSVAGGVASAQQQIGSTSGNTAVAGALSTDDIIAKTKAYLENATVTTAQLAVTADHGGYVGSLTAGASKATSAVPAGASGSNTAVAGSLSIDVDLPDTEAYVQDAKLTLAGDSWITAQETAEIAAIAGAVAYGGDKGFGVAIAINLIGFALDGTIDPAQTDAYIDGSTVIFDGGTLSITASDEAPSTQPRILAITGSGGISTSEDSDSGAGMIAVNDIQDETLAYVQSSSITQPVDEPTAADLDVQATDSSGIISVGGAVGVGGQAGIGAALSVNFITATTSAYLANSTIDFSGTVTVDATDTALIGSGTIGIAATTGSGGLAGSGSISVNEIQDVTSAFISDDIPMGATSNIASSSVTAGGTVTVTATDTSTIGSVAGGIAGASQGAAVSYNLIQNSITAYVDHSTVMTGGDLDVTATSMPLLVAVAVGGAGTGDGFALGGSITVNSIANNVDAHISDSTVVAEDSVSALALESAIMVVVAGAIAISLDGVAAGGAIAYNYIGGSFDPANPDLTGTSNTVASTNKHQVSGTITGSKVTATTGDISVEADFGPPPELPGSTDSLNFGFVQIPVPVDISSELVSVAIGAAGAQGVAVAGSLNLNFLRESVVAAITGDSSGPSIVHASTGVSVLASDSATIVAVGGGLAVGVGLEGTPGVAIGISAARNDIANSVPAYVDGSTVTSLTGDILLQATEGATIQAWTIGGAVAVGIGGAGVGLGLAGAGSGNYINNTAEAYVQDSATVTAFAGNVKILASDMPSITANGGGVGIGVGAGGGVAVSLGVGFAINSITDTVEAFVDSSTVTASDAVTIAATESAQIGGLTIGGAISAGGGGGLGIGVAAAGSTTLNTITDDIEAYINGTTSNVTASDGAVTVTATDSTSISSTGGGVAIAAGLTTGVGIAAAAGVAVLQNTMNNHILAYVDGATVTATNGNVHIEADENVTIDSISAGGAASIAVGSGAAVAGAGAGANTTNNLTNTVEAYVTGGASITTKESGDVIVKADDNPNVSATAGAASVTIATGATGSVALSIGGAVADNTIADTVYAYSDASTIDSAANVSITAVATPTAGAFALAASVSASFSLTGVGFSGGGASSTNTITNDVESYITGASPTSKSDVTAADQVTVSASETGLITATVGAGALSFAPFGASVGISLSSNQINSTIEAVVDNVKINAGSIQISSTATDTINPITTVASAFAATAAGAGGNASATVDPIVQTYVGSGAVLNAATGDVSITSTSNGTATSSNSDYSGSFIAIGDSHAEATIGNTAPTTPTVQVASYASFPTTGKNLVVVGTDSSNVLHIEVFDNTGKVVPQNNESGDATAIANLKQQIAQYSSSQQPTAAQQAQLLAEVTAILQPQVQVVSWGDGSNIPIGDNLLVTGIDNKGLLHIRIYDVCGNVVSDLTQKQIPISQTEAIANLTQQINNLAPSFTLTSDQAAQIYAEATALASLSVSTFTFVAPGASITATVGNLSVTASSTGSASATATGIAGGIGVGSDAFATTLFTNPADVEVGAGSTLSAPFGTLLVQSQTGTNASSTATSTNGGLVADSNSTATTTVDSEATTSVDSGANLSAAIVQVSAADAAPPVGSGGSGGSSSTPTSNRSATATANSTSTALVAPTDATTSLTATYVSQVNLASGANLTGDSSVKITATTGSIAVNSDPNADSDGIGEPDNNPTNILNYSSGITAAPGSSIVAGTLDVSSTTPSPTVPTTSAAATKTASNQIQFNSGVTILGIAPELKIGPTENQLVDIGNVEWSIQSNQIVVSNIQPTVPGSVVFSATGDGSPEISGTPAIDFGSAVAGVLIANESPDTLVLNNINVGNELPSSASLSSLIKVTASDSSSFNYTTGEAPESASQVLLTDSGGGDIDLDGTIDNPVGSTVITDTQASIEIPSGSSTTNQIVTNSLNLSAGGSIGDSGTIVAQLVESTFAGSPSLQASAPNGVVTLQVSALNNTTNNLTVNGSALVAETVNLTIGDGTSQTTAGAVPTETPSTYNLLGVTVSQAVNIQAGNSSAVTVNLTAPDYLPVGLITSAQGSLTLTATGGSIYNANGTPFSNNVNLKAATITLNAPAGDIGTIGGGDVPINLASPQPQTIPDVVNAIAGLDVYLNQPAGDLSLGLVNVGGVALINSAGAILKAQTSGTTLVSATDAVLLAQTGIGTAANRIATSLQQLIASAGGGPLEIVNSGPLAISSSAAAAAEPSVTFPTTLSATGQIDISAGGSLDIEQPVSATDDVDLTATGDITVEPGVSVTSTSSTVTLDATAGNVMLPALATLSGLTNSTASPSLTVFIDSTNFGGSTFNLDGTLEGNGAEITTTGSDNIININTLPSIPVTVNGGDNSSGSNNVLDITGTTGDDTFTVSASAVTVKPTEPPSQSSVPTATINYSDIQLLDVNDPSKSFGGNDTFTVTGTTAATTLNGAPGTNVVNLYASLTGSASPDAPVMFNEGPGQNIVNVFGSGQTNSGTDDPIVLAAIPSQATDQNVAAVVGQGLQFTIANPVANVATSTLSFMLDMKGGNDSAYVLGTAFPTTIVTESGSNTINLGGAPPALSIVDEGPVPASGTLLSSLFPSPSTLATDFGATQSPGTAGLITFQIPPQQTLAGFTAPITIDGGSTAILTVDDSGENLSKSALLSASSIAALGNSGAITFWNLSTLNVDLGSGASNQIQVENTLSGGGPVTINTGTGSTTVLVDQTSGTLTLDGTGGSNNSVTFDATSSPQTMSAALLNGSGGGVALTGFGPIQTVDFAGFEQANLNLGGDINSLTIDETVPNLSVNTDQRAQTGSGNQVGADDSNNAGDNTITIEQIGTSSLPGAVDQINGGIGQNTVNVDLQTNPYNTTISAIDPSLAFLKQLDLSRISSLIVNDSANSAAQAWTESDGTLLVGPGSGLPLVPSSGASTVQILGSQSGSDTLAIQNLSGATDATINGNNVKLVSGASVLQPQGFNTYNNFSQFNQIMTFGALTGGLTSFSQTLGAATFTLSSSGGTLEPEPGATPAVGTSTPQTTLTLNADGGLFAFYGVMLSAGSGGTTTVQFQGTDANGVSLPPQQFTVSAGSGLEYFPLTTPLTNLTQLTWTPGSAVTANIVLQEIYPAVSPTSISTSYNVPATNNFIGGAGVTVTFDTSHDTINGKAAGTFNGTPWYTYNANNYTYFVFQGDLYIPAGTTVNFTGNNPGEVLVANNIIVGSGATINASAIGQIGAAGGGAGGAAISGTSTKGTGGPGGPGGTGGSGGGPGFFAGQGGGTGHQASTGGSNGTTGSAGSTGNQGNPGVNTPGNAAGGTPGTGGSPGTNLISPYGSAGTAGGGGVGSSFLRGNNGNGNPGNPGVTGSSGSVGGTGGDGAAGSNNGGNNQVLAGGSGGGSGGQGGGGQGAGGGGGGGGGGGNNLNGDTGGTGGTGQSGGTGGPGGTGEPGGPGGAGGGAFELYAYGSVIVDSNGSFDAQGGQGSNGTAAASTGPVGSANDTTPITDMYPQTIAGFDDTSASAGFGGAGGSGGIGGSGGPGGAGGGGGGGGGGTVWLGASDLEDSGATINVAGGAGGSDGAGITTAPSGSGGHVILGSNTNPTVTVVENTNFTLSVTQDFGGNYIPSITWGDGSSTGFNNSSFTHAYSAPGTYQLEYSSINISPDTSIPASFYATETIVVVPASTPQAVTGSHLTLDVSGESYWGAVAGNQSGALLLTGPVGLNPFISGDTTSTPEIPGADTNINNTGLQYGSDLFGLLNTTASQLGAVSNKSDSVVWNAINKAPSNALVAVIREHAPSGMPNFTNDDVVHFVNLTTVALANPELGLSLSSTSTFYKALLNGGVETNLSTGGKLTDLTISGLPAGSVWATLVPTNLGNFYVNASLGGGQTQSISGAELTSDSVQYIDLETPTSTVGASIPGLQSVVSSPDGQTLYGINTAQNLLVVASAATLSQQQSFQNKVAQAPTGSQTVGTLVNMSDPVALAVSPDGMNVYVASGTGSQIAIFSRGASGNLVFQGKQDAPGIGTVTSLAVSGSSAGTDELFVGGTEGVLKFQGSTTANTLTAKLQSPVGLGSVSSLSVSSDGQVVNATLPAQNAIDVLSTSNLSLVGQSISTTTLEGASSVAASSNTVELGTLNDSTLVTALASTAGLFAGEQVSGSGIPSGTTIALINSSSSLTLSQSETLSAAAYLTFFGDGPALEGTLNGTKSVTQLSTTAGLYVGEPISGAGIPFGTTITQIPSGSSSITLSNTATGNGPEPLTAIDDYTFLSGSLSGTSVTGLAGEASLYVGEPVSGNGIPAGTTIARALRSQLDHAQQSSNSQRIGNPLLLQRHPVSNRHAEFIDRGYQAPDNARVDRGRGSHRRRHPRGHNHRRDRFIHIDRPQPASDDERLDDPEFRHQRHGAGRQH